MGGFQYNKPNFGLSIKLAQSGLWFAARKSYSEANDLASLLDAGGTTRSWSEFKKLAAPIVGKYNNTWLKTEYNTATRSARIASIWVDMERTKDLYPNVEYIRTRSAEPRQQHLEYVGIIRPYNDPFWVTHTPPLEWNCKCSIRQTKATITPIPEGLPEPVTGLANNAALSEQIFSEEHPYAKNAKEIEDSLQKDFFQARANMGMFFKVQTPKNNITLVHPGHTASDVAKNLPTAIQLTDAGYKVELPAHIEKEKISRPDLKINGVLADLKEPASERKELPKEAHKSFKKLIDKASDQNVRIVVFRFDKSLLKYTINDLERGLNKAFIHEKKPINRGIDNVIIIGQDGKITELKRQDIINKKIKWAQLPIML